MHAERVRRLQGLLQDGGWDAAALTPGPTLFYLTGLSFHVSERPVVGLFPSEGRPRFVVPDLESEKAGSTPLEVEVVTFGEDETSRAQAFERGARSLRPGRARVAIEPLRLRFFELGLLRLAAPGWQLESGEGAFTRLRLVKEPAEVDSMRRATQTAQAAMQALLPTIRVGMTEREMATALTLELFRAGSDSEFPFPPIVASGPNSARPHAVPSDRQLESGDLLLFDWSTSFGGYVSDLTRTFALGDPGPEWPEIYSAVERANAAGRAAVRPGASCASIDAAARQVIEAAGWEKQFIHRTGHGIGLEGHEPPYIRGDNPEILEPGMTFTVEPGIYLPGRGGVRIEDNLVVTPAGGESLSDFPRALRRLG